LEVCVPLAEIFNKTEVEVLEDKATGVNLVDRFITGESGSVYRFDRLVLAVGSETTYYDTPGLKELAFGFKTIEEALKLKRHLHEVMAEANQKQDRENTVSAAHVVVVGGGASGTELAAELAIYLKKLVGEHEIDPAMVTVELVQSPNRLVPNLPEDVSEKIERKIREVGVNVFLNRRLVKEEVESVFLKDMEMKTKTVVWTAGVKPNGLFGQISGLKLAENGQVEVDRGCKAMGVHGVYVVGDGAKTKYTGMAQTALNDGKNVALRIASNIQGKEIPAYKEREPIYAIPVGPNWAAVVIGRWKIYGKLGWILRRLLDLWVFWQLLPPKKAWRAFKSGEVLCESCPVCGG
jgi:NADH dehydrogenase